MSINQARIGGITILAIVLLRLVVGWHFFSEGRKKLVYDEDGGRYRLNPSFSAEGFLRQAKGPMAEVVRDMLPSAHNWESLLASAQQQTPLSEEQAAQRADWAYAYEQRRKQARDAEEPVPIELPEFAPYYDWAVQVVTDWKSMLKNITAIDALSDDQRKAAASAFVLRNQQLADYLAGQSELIADYRHELWRLEQAEADEKAGRVPFHDQQIRIKSAEVSRLPRPWVNQVAEFEQGYYLDLHEILTAEQRADSAVTSEFDHAMADPGAASLARINMTVACLTVCVGLCLLLGFFTRLASLAGIVFLGSVMGSQPPGVAGADTSYFFYQIVECAALLLLFVVGAGRWLGIDYFTYAIWSWIFGARGKT